MAATAILNFTGAGQVISINGIAYQITEKITGAKHY
jgi:hypothetical protein